MTAPAPRAKPGQLIFGVMAGHAVGAAARLGVADAVGDDTRTAEEVAASTGADPGATTRLLRALAALELVTEASAGTFALTPTGALPRRPERPRHVGQPGRQGTYPRRVRGVVPAGGLRTDRCSPAAGTGGIQRAGGGTGPTR